LLEPGRDLASRSATLSTMARRLSIAATTRPSISGGCVAITHPDPAYPVLPGPVSVVVAHQLIDHSAGKARVLQPGGKGMAQVVRAVKVEVVELPHLGRLHRSPQRDAIPAGGRNHDSGGFQLAQRRLDRRGPQPGAGCAEAVI
jgi:hypothetical protein